MDPAPVAAKPYKEAETLPPGPNLHRRSSLCTRNPPRAWKMYPTSGKFTPGTANLSQERQIQPRASSWRVPEGWEAPSILLAIDGSSAPVTGAAHPDAPKGHCGEEEGRSGDPPAYKGQNDTPEAARSKTGPNSINSVPLEAAIGA